MSEHLKPGDFIKLNTPTGLKTWYVTGVHLGALHQQSVVTISPFIKTDADIYGKKVQELQVPMEFIDLKARIERLEKALEWLEKNGTLAHIYEEGRPEKTMAVIQVPAFNFDFDDMTIEQAIAKAVLEEANASAAR
jgi:hypothetical protein